MFTKQTLMEHLEKISENAKFIKFDFVSTENFSVSLKCKVETKQNKAYYDAFVLQWIKKFSMFTATTWIVRNSFPKVTRILYRKLYNCHRASFNKKKTTSLTTLNQECRAKIDFKLKFINRNTIRNDKCLREGLNMNITIEFVHTHKLRTPEAVNMLKSTSDTNDLFFKYFSTGYSPTGAKKYHELLICERYGDSPEYIMNANINPTMRHIMYLHSKAKPNNWSNQSFEELMEPRKRSLESAGGFLTYDTLKVVILITPLMKRVITTLDLDHIIVDSTSIGVIKTFLYVPSKAGALPIACILHTEKCKTFYIQALLEAKQALENIGNIIVVPKIITIKDCNEVRDAVKVIFPNAKVVTSKWSLRSDVWRLICSEDIKIESRKRHPLMELFNNIIRSCNVEVGEKHYHRLKDEEYVTSSQLLSKRVEQLWQSRDQWMLKYEDTCMNLVEASILITKEFIRRRCKSFNTYIMVDVVTNILEDKLRNVLLSHVKNQNLVSAYTRSSITSKEVIKAIGCNEFRVEITSSKKPKVIKFRIDTWCCNCSIGRYGRFCEHLSAVLNFQDTELLRSIELTDEEKYLFTEIAGGDKEEENLSMKSEIAVSNDANDNVEVSDSYKDNKNDFAMDVVEEERPISPESLDADNDYFHLEVKTEPLDSNDPLEEDKNISTGITRDMISDNSEEIITREIDYTMDSSRATKVALRNRYENVMRTLNDEFRRLNNYFKMNPNKSNMETMERLARELRKIRPIERVNFANMHISLNNEENNSNIK
ncbi:unnamed protein product [Diatraea saccharalis]|uniref:SWIM-type domain-containing protein n=1 Tax=Diatraea saccharalis TaxID=40085 RepID=A0A9N9R7X6_9NEOP|nr:unnamed protein product [Diatraea saccharalis]